MTKRYVLTEAAEADLRGVVRYTMQRLANTQVWRYIAAWNSKVPGRIH